MANKRLDESLGTVGYDNLFVENVPEADVVTVKLAASQGILARGSLISGAPGDNFSLVAAALGNKVTVTGEAESATVTETAVYVLADDVDTGTSASPTELDTSTAPHSSSIAPIPLLQRMKSSCAARVFCCPTRWTTKRMEGKRHGFQFLRYP